MILECKEVLSDVHIIQIFTRLVYDAVFVLGRALHDHLYRGYELYETKLSCLTPPDQINEFGRENFWKNGSALVREIKHVGAIIVIDYRRRWMCFVQSS